MMMKVQVPADPAHSYNLNMLMEGATFYEYAGSLTAPPCAETVVWLVRSDTVKASDKQVLYLHDAVYKITADFGNYRSLMPLNGRVVSMRQGVQEDLPPTAAPPVPLPGKPQQSDREFRAMKWAMDAMVIAKSATDYVKDLDNRLRNAAQAHANALAPQLEPLKVHGQVITVGGSAAVANASMMRAGMYPPGMGPTLQPGMGGYTQSPLEMQKTAETMARTLASAARQEIDDATREISRTSKKVAMDAAKQAADMVMTGSMQDPYEKLSASADPAQQAMQEQLAAYHQQAAVAGGQPAAPGVPAGGAAVGTPPAAGMAPPPTGAQR